MRIFLFSSKKYDEVYFDKVNEDDKLDNEIFYIHERLNLETAGYLSNKKADAVCIFVNDDCSRPVLEKLAEVGVKVVALRCAGFNNVDLKAAKELGIEVVRVPAYSPESVAEHAAALLFTLNRKIHRAYNRTREGNFNLEHLTGICLYGKTAGIIGTGKIGFAFIRILLGCGMRVLCFDPYPNQDVIDSGAEYVDLDTLYAQSDVISLHCPLTPENYHLIDEKAFEKMKDKVIIINSGRGALLDTAAAITAIRNGKVSALGLDVYENEQPLFFQDKSHEALADDLFLRLISLPNVLLTGHQAFLTIEALTAIASVTLHNIEDVKNGVPRVNSLLNMA